MRDKFAVIALLMVGAAVLWWNLAPVPGSRRAGRDRMRTPAQRWAPAEPGAELPDAPSTPAEAAERAVDASPSTPPAS